MPTTTIHTNKLINEKSPYLLQHAHNPVDWYPWGDEAFNKAKAEDKPVFLSIGYSTCHWCHVMAHESFESDEVAALLNEHFISIKVDREERPDVDNFYMEVSVAFTGSGGWPLSCFLTPDRKTFFSGTYFPKTDSQYGAGFLTILNRIIELWKHKRTDLISASESILQQLHKPLKKSELNEKASLTAYNQLSKSFDSKYGGFGNAPKFPTLQNIMFLILYGIANNENSAFESVKTTLDGMQAGGINDHVGGGFCRYSTDDKWLVPHFEKMMVDNAMFILVYSQAGAVLKAEYFDTVRELVKFCTKEMKHPSGGFFAAMDADSEGVEGKYYVFTPDDITNALGADDNADKTYCKLFDITRSGNFEGNNIPNLIGKSLSDNEIDFAKTANEKLFKYRAKRIPPFRDEKVMASVNCLMIAGLAVAGRIMDEDSYIQFAQSCASFVLENLVKDGRLQSYWRDGASNIPASSDDYAYLIWGLIELYESTFDPLWLEKALLFTNSMNSLFWDESGGGYFISGNDIDDLPLRQKNLHDGALPCGNSVAAMNLLRLSRICGNSEFEQYASDIITLMASGINSYPMAYCGILCADLYLKYKGREIVIVNGDGLEEMKEKLPRFSSFTVNSICGEGYDKMSRLAPFLKDYKAIDGKATAYVCCGGSCMQPVNDPESFKKLLENQPKI
jgi:uncharacterized protein YyaL (SSP411 family)